MKKWIKKFEDAMSAISFAEAGEFETARELAKGRQKVLLTLIGRESDRKTFKYALNICKRIGIDLEILYVSRGSEIAELLEDFQHELKDKGIGYEIIPSSGCIKKAIIDHTKKRSDIQFVIIESSDGLEIECRKDDRALSKEWGELKCPLVVVS